MQSQEICNADFVIDFNPDLMFFFHYQKLNFIWHYLYSYLCHLEVYLAFCLKNPRSIVMQHNFKISVLLDGVDV